MDFFAPKLNAYIESHTEAESALMYELNRDTHIKAMMPQMLSGHLQGQVLRMFSFMIKPFNVLEIGTYTGYSALCLTAGLQPEGTLYTIDINDELEEMVRNYFDRAGMTSQIDYRIGNAMNIIPELDAAFDIVFIDADKVNYSHYYDLVFDKVNAGGFIIADNVLWSGKVIEPKPDKDTLAIMAFNEKVHNDERVENVLFPIRDGLMVMRKKFDDN